MNRTSRLLACDRSHFAPQKVALAALLLLILAGVGPGKALATDAASVADLKYLPDDCDAVITADVNGMISSNAGQKIKAGATEFIDTVKGKMAKDSKILPEDIGRVTFGVSMKGKKGTGVLHMNRAIGEKDFTDLDKATKKAVGKYQLYVQNGDAFCLVDDRTLAVGNEDTLTQALERNGPAKLSDDLKGAMASVDFTKSFAAAMSMKNLVGAGGGQVPPGADGVRTVSLQAEVADDIKLKAVAACKDAATAEQMKQMADGVLASFKANAAQMPPPVSKLLNALETSKTEATLGAALTVDAETLVALVQLAAKGAHP